MLVGRRNKVQGYMYQIYLDGHYRSIIISSFLQFSQCIIDAHNSTCLLWPFGCCSVIFSFSLSWILDENHCTICTATFFLAPFSVILRPSSDVAFWIFLLKYVFRKPLFPKINEVYAYVVLGWILEKCKTAKLQCWAFRVTQFHHVVAYTAIVWFNCLDAFL